MHSCFFRTLVASLWVGASAFAAAPAPSSPPAAAPAPDPLRWWLPANRPAEAEYEKTLLAAPQGPSLRSFHDLVASEAHLAGSEGDRKVIDGIAAAFTAMGLEVEKQELWLYLCRPDAAAVEIVSPSPMSLPITEDALSEDPFSQHLSNAIGWNAYSGSGDITAPVVYANFGRKEDFERLRELKIDVNGKIVLARYGGNFRGYKAKYAEENGAAGLIIFTDPADSGYTQGLMYPEGGYATGSEIQRGSILTLPFTGDPLTPFEPATKDAKRLDPSTLALPKIPVQPIGWKSAQEILSRMKGPPVPPGAPGAPGAWQGGLPFTYRLTGDAPNATGEATAAPLLVRLMVKQTRSIMQTANVVATLRGATLPDQKVIFGCHHDAWVYGAQDPTSGTILVLEAARCLSEAAKNGRRPARSVVFATWGAEEFGIIGSAEWVEAHRDDLAKNAVAYMNCDAATFGMQFGASGSPSLKPLIAEVSESVYGAAPGPMASAHAEPSMRSERPAAAGAGAAGRPRIGDMGGGSDHVGFLCHVGVASCGISATGARGTAYHSIYDNLHWYRQVLGDDYESAVALTRVANLLLARLANADVLPFAPAQASTEFANHLDTLTARAETLGLKVDFAKLKQIAGEREARARLVSERLATAIDRRDPSREMLAEVNQALLSLDRAWITPEGLDSRPWYRNLYAAPDETSGYASWVLPGLRAAIEKKDIAALDAVQQNYFTVFDSIDQGLEQIDSAIK